MTWPDITDARDVESKARFGCGMDSFAANAKRIAHGKKPRNQASLSKSPTMT
jgi:hypothetical protein